jgi:hypothetical protein
VKARLRSLRTRRVVWGPLGLAGALVLLAHPAAHADVWANVGPASPLGAAGLDGRYPLGNYALDEHFSAVTAGVFSGVDVSGVGPMIAYFFANELWQLTAWLADTLIDLFGFAFSLDLVNGSSATGGAGALGPVSRAIHSIYADAFGGPWMVLAVSATGCWAMWRALVQRRYAETAGRLALSLIYIGIALFFVLEPAQTIGTASGWTNEMSGAFLSIAKDGDPGSPEEAKQSGADQLFGLLVAEPWSVLEFGGVEHCVKAGGGDEPESVAVQPLPEGAARRLEAGEQVSAGGKTCIQDLKKYGGHFLRFAPGSDERNEEFDALSEGDSSKLPGADPGKSNGSYELGPADKPAAAAMEEGGQYQRLLVAIVVFLCELGAFCLLGALSVGVILAQVLLLLLLAFSPVALVAAAIPGRGHDFFKGWLTKLAGVLLRKAAYSLILAVLLSVCAAIASATSELGWLMSFGLQSLFFWTVFVQRKTLTESLVGIATGPGAPGRDRALGVLALYAGARVGTRPLRRVGRGARSTVTSTRRRFARANRDVPRSRPAERDKVQPPTAPVRPRPRTAKAAAPEVPVAADAPADYVQTGRTGGRETGDRKPTGETDRRPTAGHETRRRAAAEKGDGREPGPTRRPIARKAPATETPQKRKADTEGPQEPPRRTREETGRKKSPGPRPADRPAPARASTARPMPRKGAPASERPLAEELRADKERATRAARADRSAGSRVEPPASNALPPERPRPSRRPVRSPDPAPPATRAGRTARQGRRRPDRKGGGAR